MSIHAVRQLNAQRAEIARLQQELARTSWTQNIEEAIWRISQGEPKVFANWKRGGPMTCAATGEAYGRLIIPDPRQVRGAVWDHSQPNYN